MTGTDPAYFEAMYADEEARERQERAHAHRRHHDEPSAQDVFERAQEVHDDRPWLTYEQARLYALAELRSRR